MLSLRVNASKTYDVTLAENMDAFAEKALSLTVGDKIAVIADSETERLYGEELIKLICGKCDKKVFLHTVRQGENSKNLVNYGILLNALAQDGLTRKDAVVTFGGGMVGDLGAFVASTYMRGVKLIALPTTLLSMVDSSVGGKTAVNLDKGKNLCGTFYQPDAVYINLGFLVTLPEREKTSGMGEVVKYSFLPGGENVTCDGKITERLVYECLKIKAGVVARDERESGERKLLNFGHTVGHAIEKLSDFNLSHGLCVAKGIKYALDLSRAYYGVSAEKFAPLYNRLAIFEDLSCGYSPESVAEVVLSDKKSDGKGVDFVLIDEEFKTRIINIPAERLVGFLKQGAAINED